MTHKVFIFATDEHQLSEDEIRDLQAHANNVIGSSIDETKVPRFGTALCTITAYTSRINADESKRKYDITIFEHSPAIFNDKNLKQRLEVLAKKIDEYLLVNSEDLKTDDKEYSITIGIGNSLDVAYDYANTDSDMFHKAIIQLIEHVRSRQSKRIRDTDALDLLLNGDRVKIDD